ncbi:integrase [Citrobacter freundii]|uniref:phage tail protein n=3 Tax=Citrobacter freundii TaxID=546 RepID=UPI00103A1347|nr:phage tail protein [Citrobacter freundii]TBW04194.1 integrase [Citrobacter freundii]TKI75347.1 integrase [Citrobacter freundii]
MRPLMPPVQTPDNLFHDGNPLTGELGTIVDAEHLNNVQGAVRDAQSELITVLTAAGINVDPTKQNQLLTALKALLLSRSNPFGDIKSDGAAAIATALTNLGLGEGSALPVGIPVPWPSATPPTGWLKCNGATFTAAQYPKLAQVYPTLILPDLRGEFIRGWDDGRGVDPGRPILSNQLHMLASHSHTLVSWPNSGNPASHGGAQDANGGDGGAYQSNSPVLPSGGTETRPRNIAFNYIVRAA